MTRDWQTDIETAIEQEQQVKELEEIVQSYYAGECMPVTPASWYFERFSMLLDVLGQYKEAFEKSYQRNVVANAKIGEHVTRAQAAEAREKKLREAIEKSLSIYHDDGLNDEEAVEAIRDELESILTSLYPEEETK